MLARRLASVRHALSIGFLGYMTYIAAHNAAARPPQPPAQPTMVSAPTSALRL
ncbi:MAG: hypothetical protein ACK4WH_01150 [Phycisphaerales bacterium]